MGDELVPAPGTTLDMMNKEIKNGGRAASK
jgi:hypothetical protein